MLRLGGVGKKPRLKWESRLVCLSKQARIVSVRQVLCKLVRLRGARMHLRWQAASLVSRIRLGLLINRIAITRASRIIATHGSEERAKVYRTVKTIQTQ